MATEDTEVVLIEPDKPMATGKIVDELDENHQPTGFKLFIPTEDERKKMADRLDEELRYSENEYQEIWGRMLANIRAYEALPDDKDSMLTLPLGKKDVNHLVGFYVNRVWNKRPICSVIPEEFGDYEVPIPQGKDPLTGQTMSRVEMRSAEEIAEGGERLLEHYLRGPKLGFHKFLYEVVMSAVQGAPAWGETCYERVVRPQLVPKWKRLGDRVVADGYREAQRVVGSPHKMIAHSGFNVMMSSPWLDPQETEMLAKKATCSVEEGRNKLKQNRWYLCTDEEFEDMRKAVGSFDQRKDEVQDELADARKVDKPRAMMDIASVQIYWPITFEDDQGELMEGVFDLLVDFDRTTRTVLSCDLNPYAHGRRKLVNYVQRPRPFGLGGYSTMEDVAPLQKVQTRLFHSQVQNAMLANTVYAKVRPGSTAWQWLKSNEIRARSKVPVTNPQDFTAEVLGRELRSLAPEIAAIGNFATGITVSDTVRGAQLQGRTSRAAIALVQDAGLTVPNMDLDFLQDRLSENVTMLFHNIGQWAMYGEDIPFQNPEQRAIAMKAVEFPLDGLNSFTVRISASSDEDTTQFEFERDLGLAKLQGEKAMEFAQMIGPMLNPQAPPVMAEIILPQLEAQQLMLARIFELAKLDPKKYTFTRKQLEDIFQRHLQNVAAEKQRQQEEQIAAQAEAIRRANAGGGGAVVQGAFGGGPGAGPAGANPQGTAGVGGQPGNPALPPAPPVGVP